jgi:HAMP domain-containing protein
VPISAAAQFSLPDSYAFLQPGEDTFLKDAISTSFIGNGIIMVAGNIMLGSCTPIYNAAGVIAGYALAGRIQTQAMVQALADNSQQCVTSLNLQDTAVQNAYSGFVSKVNPTVPLPTDVWQVDSNSYQSLLDNLFMQNRACGSFGVRTQNPRIMGLLTLVDSYGNKAVIYRVDISRNDLLTLIAGLFTAFGVLLIILLLTSIVVVLFLDRAVLHKVGFITKEVEQITVAQDMHARVGGDRIIPTDELGQLASCINMMLESLEDSSKRIENVLTVTLANEERARCIMASINDFIICVLKSDGMIKETNPSFADRFKFDLKGSKGSSSIEQFMHEIKLAELIEISENANVKEGFFTTRFKEKIPVSIRVTTTKIIIDDEPTEALVITAQNNTEESAMKNKLQKMQDDLDFKEMWKNPIRRAAFGKFCEHEKSSENFMFVEQVEAYRVMHNVTERVKKQHEILSKFLNPSGEYQINVSGTVLERELPLIKEGYAQRDLFDKLLKFVNNMIASDTFRRFKLLPLKEQGIDVTEDKITSETAPLL